MIIYVCSNEFDPLGLTLINALPSSDLGSMSRRVSRSKTLDGGAYINDNGYTDADREIRIQFRFEGADVDNIKRMVALYPLLRLSCIEGFFLGVIESVSSEVDGIFTLKFLVKERLDNGIIG